MSEPELRALLWIVVACLAFVVAATALLVRSGRTVSFPMLERRLRRSPGRQASRAPPAGAPVGSGLRRSRPAPTV